MAGKLDFTFDQSHSHPSQFITHFHLETRVKRDLIHHMTAKNASNLNPKPQNTDNKLQKAQMIILTISTNETKDAF